MARLRTEDDVAIAYDDTGGDGRPVVLVHGWPLTRESWSRQVSALVEAGHRVITYDRRGFGESDHPTAGFDYDTLTADLAALIEHLDLRDLTLVGFSMGGGEVVRLLSSRGSKRIRSAILLAAAPPHLMRTDDDPDGGMVEADVEGIRGAIRADRDGFLEMFATGWFSGDGRLLVEEPERRRTLDQARQASEVGLLACVDAFARTDFRTDLGTIDVPLLLVHGDADANLPMQFTSERTSRLVDGAELRVIEGAPHGLMVSHADQVNAALLDFLTR